MGTVTRIARGAARGVSETAAAVSGLAFLALFVVNVAQIIMRTFFDGGWIWVTDLSKLLFIWMVMMGAVTAYHQRNHIVVDFLVARLSGARETVSAVVIRAIELGLFAAVLVGGLEVTANRGGIAYIQLGVPTAWGFAALPVSAALLLLVALTLPLRFQREQALDAIGDLDDPDATTPDEADAAASRPQEPR